MAAAHVNAIAELRIPVLWANLERRPDRRAECEEELSWHGLARWAERVEAVDGQTVLTAEDLHRHRRRALRPDGRPSARFRAPAMVAGMVGCWLSHRRMLARAQEIAHSTGAEAVLLLEDDVTFAPDLKTRWQAVLPQVPDHWWLINLGGFPTGPTEWIAPGVIASAGSECAHAYVLRTAALQDFDALISDRNAEIDIQWAPWYQARRAFTLRPHLAGQRRSRSNISGFTKDTWPQDREWWL